MLKCTQEELNNIFDWGCGDPTNYCAPDPEYPEDEDYIPLFKNGVKKVNRSYEGLDFSHLVDYDGLYDVNFDGDILKGADFHDVTFYGCSFINTDLSNAILNGAHFNECTFINTNLSNTSLEDLYGKEYNLMDCRVSDLYGCKLINCNLENMNLNTTDLEGTLFKYCNMKNASLDEVKLRRTEFIGNTGKLTSHKPEIIGLKEYIDSVKSIIDVSDSIDEELVKFNTTVPEFAKDMHNKFLYGKKSRSKKSLREKMGYYIPSLRKLKNAREQYYDPEHDEFLMILPLHTWAGYEDDGYAIVLLDKERFLSNNKLVTSDGVEHQMNEDIASIPLRK